MYWNTSINMIAYLQTIDTIIVPHPPLSNVQDILYCQTEISIIIIKLQGVIPNCFHVMSPTDCPHVGHCRTESVQGDHSGRAGQWRGHGGPRRCNAGKRPGDQVKASSREVSHCYTRKGS